MIVNTIGGIALIMIMFAFICIFWHDSGGDVNEAFQNRELAKIIGLLLIAAAICFK